MPIFGILLNAPSVSVHTPQLLKLDKFISQVPQNDFYFQHSDQWEAIGSAAGMQAQKAAVVNVI